MWCIESEELSSYCTFGEWALTASYNSCELLPWYPSHIKNRLRVSQHVCVNFPPFFRPRIKSWWNTTLAWWYNSYLSSTSKRQMQTSRLGVFNTSCLLCSSLKGRLILLHEAQILTWAQMWLEVPDWHVRWQLCPTSLNSGMCSLLSIYTKKSF